MYALRRRGYDTRGLFSKSWDQLHLSEPEKLDFVITVCDKAANDRLPPWVGDPITALWKFRAPGAEQGTDSAIHAVFDEVCEQIEDAVSTLVRLPLDHADRRELATLIERAGPG